MTVNKKSSFFYGYRSSVHQEAWLVGVQDWAFEKEGELVKRTLSTSMVSYIQNGALPHPVKSVG
jgi:hypothetical protein